MAYFTWSTVRDKLERDLMLEDEDWVDETEMLGYVNDAIRDCEALILTLYEDYFLDYATITFTSGQTEVSLPSNIYASKIRRFLFEKESERYVIQRVKSWHKFEEKSLTDYQSTSSRYEYFPINRDTASDLTLVMTPAIRSADAGAYGKLWYIRNANEITTSSDSIDIPEFINFIYAHMKFRIYSKEGHPNTALAGAELQHQKDLMEGTLSEMTPDDDNEIQPDLQYYEEMN